MIGAYNRDVSIRKALRKRPNFERNLWLLLGK